MRAEPSTVVGIDVISKVLWLSNISTTMRYARVESALVKAGDGERAAADCQTFAGRGCAARHDEKRGPRKGVVLTLG
jgi:hypothetical protein